MPDRSVVVRLRAEVDGFNRAMKSAASSSKAVGDETIKSSQKASSLLDRLTKSAENNSAAWKASGRIMMAAGAAVGAGLVVAIKTSMDFEKQLSGVQAVANATAQEMTNLRAAAIKAGADTVFSAKDAAKAEEELAKAGISTADILGGALRGSLNLAASAQLDLGRSAEISGQAMKIFGLRGKDVGHIADVLSAGANKSAADVDTLAQAMQQSGLVAAQTGLGLEDTVGILSAFADNALQGSDAGTSLKTMLQRLNPQSAEAAAMMKKLGLSAYDSQGNFVGLATYAGRLQQAFGDMSPEARNAAMQVLFGSDAVRAANVLYKLGADGVNEYTKAVDDNGAASRTAAIQMDNLSGDLEQLRGSIESALIQSGSAGNDMLRQITQSVTGAVNAFNDLPPGVQKAVGVTAALSSGVLFAGGAFVTLAPKVRAARTEIATLGLTSGKTGMALKGLAAAGTALVALQFVPDLMTKIDESMGTVPKSASNLAAALFELGSTGAVSSDLTKSWGEDFHGYSKRFQLDAEGLGQAVDRLTTGNWASRDPGPLKSIAAENIEKIDQALTVLASHSAPDAEQAFEALASKAGLSADQTERFRTLLPGFSGAMSDVALQEKIAAQNGADVSGAFGDMGGAASGATVDLKAFDSALKALFDQTFSVEQATDAWHSSLNALKDAVKENGRSTKGNSDAAIANREALRTSAERAYDLVQAYADAGHSAEEVTAKSKSLKDEFIKQAEKAGFSRTAAEKYASALDDIPGTYAANIQLNGVKTAMTQASAIAAEIAKIPRRKTTDIVVRKIGAQNDALARADGGRIPLGLGGPRQDNVLVAASSGEFFVNAAATAKHLPLLEAINAGRFADGGLVGYADGGQVGAGTKSDLIRAFGRDMGAQVVQAFADGMGSGKGSVKSVAEQIRSIVSDSAKKASDEITNLMTEQADYATSLAQKFTGLGDVTSFDPSQSGRITEVGPDGVERDVTAQSSIAGMLQSARSQTQSFEATLKRLKALGARTDILQQLLDKGPEAATAAAALASLGKSGIAGVNADQARLVSAAGSLGQFGAGLVYAPKLQAARQSAIDSKALEVAVQRATGGQLAELKKVTAEGRATNVALSKLAGQLADALSHQGAKTQAGERNRPRS